MKPVCVTCQRFYRSERNGYWFTEGKPIGPERAQPGTLEPEKWIPYKVWIGDLWKCQGCGHLLISGVGFVPASRDYLPNMQAALARSQMQVNDC